MTASSVVDQLIRLPEAQRQLVFDNLGSDERKLLMKMLDERVGNKWANYVDDPVGFVTRGIGESAWSKQRAILESVRDHKRTAVPAGHAPGKAAEISTPVLTTRGWVKHGELLPGDYVYGPDGKPVVVAQVTHPHERECYRVLFDDGHEVVVADAHEWTVRVGRKGRVETRETQQMLDVWATNGATRLARYRIDVAEPIQASQPWSGLDPYLFGYWLGDGDTARPYITCHTDDQPNLLSRIEALGIRYRLLPTYRVSMLGVSNLLPLHHKHIPKAMFTAPVDDRLAMLRGLMDSDGHRNDDGTVEISQKNAELARDIRRLAESLGEKVTLRSGPAVLNGKAVGERHRVCWTPRCFEPFTLPRKRGGVKPVGRHVARSIVAVEPVGPRMVNCIQVDRADGLYLIDGPIPTHNSHIAARVVGWWGASHPPGTAMVATTATTFRQVRNILWPHVRRLVERHDLPGHTSQVEWRMGSELIAYGFSSGDNNEAAVQGIHAPHLLIVVDEAGGISHTLGQAMEALMTGDHTRLLVIGNPPTDDEGSWFERACNSPLYNVIPISAYDTPNFTGEDPGQCKSCPPTTPTHSVGTHLVDRDWVEDVIAEFGEDSAFVQARVFARFPRNSINRVIPLTWCEMAQANEDYVSSGRIRLGVDVAADGGDEFVVAWADGMKGSIHHKSSGGENQNAVDVAFAILKQIRAAEAVHKERGIPEPVRVKIDALGVGWGVVGILEMWGREGKHHSTIVGVKVSERAGDPEKYTNQRAEMWWTGRMLVQPDADDRQQIKLDVDRTTIAQLAGPKYKSDSAGRIQIESKPDMKRRGVPSPDRAEAILLAFYEPPGKAPIPTVAPVSISQTNSWRL